MGVATNEAGGARVSGSAYGDEALQLDLGPVLSQSSIVRAARDANHAAAT